MDSATRGVTIPIRNLYYLLIYAWDRLDEAEVVDASGAPMTDLVDLFARLLASGVSHVMRRGLDRGYVSHTEEVAGVRGRIAMSASLQRGSLWKARTVSVFDEMTHDILSNRILKATIASLLATKLDGSNHELLTELSRRLGDVKAVRLTGSDFRRVQVHRNNAFYAFLLQVCELIHERLLPDEQAGALQFRSFVNDQVKMRLLFQQFVFNFLKREQSALQVRSQRMSWRNSLTNERRVMLPGMQTDIVLSSASRKTVIDTKYTPNALQTGQHGTSLRSDHLYQLYAYLRNIPKDNPDQIVSGLLLYPKIGDAVELSYDLDGYFVRIQTLDLNQPWQEIRNRLLTIAA
jgi:5-methylcytosine-specific restriction enzyme subunit McrC